ncbi:hypothetical protein ZW61_002674 [Salmonella enterica subsp. houtenae]|nr:hypothetical protein [Salmonella enterica]ECD9545768.1 hypothetical protein [Salmonella enterica subsp. houtenae]ECM3643060.1 hypothetical protein [Salmonella enterica subsp. enterica serovar Typhimurium]EDQ4517672.1 hypothetical protein [Salmonella enterica subsp. enterica]EAY0431033.1 hypothetical protein [Salmonella enterica]
MTIKNGLAELPEPVRTHGFIWDADNARLLAYALKPEYEVTGMWPSNGIDVNDAVATEFTGQPPEGKKLAWERMECQHGLISRHHQIQNY